MSRGFVLGFLVMIADPPTARAARVSIAGASNLVFVLEALTAAFSTENPDTQVRTSLASSGSLVAQIRHGAPFDIFLSADLDYPRALIESGDAIAASGFTFAQATLELWPTDRWADDDWVNALQQPEVRRIAIANPDTAPYGQVAKKLLQDAGIWERIAPKLIIGENLAQTFQFVDSGNADIGFIGGSMLAPQTSSRRPGASRSLLLPVTLPQGAILLRRGRDNPAATTFLTWLRSHAAQTILTKWGYQSGEVPGGRPATSTPPDPDPS